MRMWMIPPSEMCDKHLRGEYHELFMIEGSILKGKNIGWALNGMVFPEFLRTRYDELFSEMKKRGMKPRKELKIKIWQIPDKCFSRIGWNSKHNRRELSLRCAECEKRIKKR
jgi:hypothetical protein